MDRLNMKHLLIVFTAGLILTVAASNLMAYELAPHGRMTNEAFKMSILADPKFIKQLGIENVEDPFGEKFYDVFKETIHIRLIHEYEETDFRMPKGARPLSIEGWLIKTSTPGRRGEPLPSKKPQLFGLRPILQ